MQITHTRDKSQWDEETKQYGKPESVKTTYKNVHEVSNYQHLQWSLIYWAEGRTGPRAYAFDKWGVDGGVTTLVFDNQGEMARFKEDLRLQEEAHARAQAST